MEVEEVDIHSVKFLCSKGCLVTSTVNPEVTCKFPEGAVTTGDKSFCRVSVQVSNIDETLVLKHLGKNAAVSPLVMLEPLKRRFHKQLTLTIPVPGHKNKKIDKKNIRLLFSITGSKDQCDWQDITTGTHIKGLETGKVSLDTVVTGRFMLVCCDNSIMDIPATMTDMLKSYMNGGSFGASNCQPHLDLLKAARCGDVAALQSCLDCDSVDINYPNKGGQTALHLACKEGHIKVVKELLQRKSDYKLSTKKGNAPIHLACYYGHKDVVQALLDHGCDVNFSLKDHICPLYPAILESHCGIVQLLLQRGGDIMWVSQDGLPLPIVAVFSTYDRDKINTMFELLLQEVDFSHITLNQQMRNMGFRSFGEALIHCLASRKAAGDMLGPVRQRLSNLSTELLQDDLASTELCRDDLKLFLTVVKEGDNEKCSDMLSQEKYVHLKTQCDISALHVACLHGHTDIAAKLVEAGADVNLQSRGGFTCLYLASIGGYTEIVHCLLTAGARTDSVNKYGLRASDIATEMGHIDTLSAIQEHEKEHYNVLVATGNGALTRTSLCEDREGDKEEEAMKKGCCAF